MSQDNIRILVVDDSAVSRAMICDQIEAAPEMSLAGKARNGRDAIDKAAALRPDVITLDLRMPDMDGLEVLDAVLRHDPIPIIMVSSLTVAGAAVTLDALDRGAVDYVAKPEHVPGVRPVFGDELVTKIRGAAGVDVPGGKHLEISRRGLQARVLIHEGEPMSGHKPSVDVLMFSAAKTFGPNCLGVIMTGMGHDGVDGCCAIRAAGGYVLGQDEASSDVYGMNKIAFRNGHVDQQFGLSEAAAVIARQVRLVGRKTELA